MRKLIFSISGLFILILLVGSLFVSFQGCNKDEITSPTSNNKIGFELTGSGCSALDPMTTPIYAGQTILAGYLKVWNTTEKLFVKYDFGTGFTATTLHLWVGCDLLLVPQNNGNPQPGQFTNVYTNTTPFSNYTFEIPLASLTSCGILYPCSGSAPDIYLIAHADINTPNNGGQTGFSYLGDVTCGKEFCQQWPGKPKPNDPSGCGGRWGWITCYKFCCNPENPEPPQTDYYSETAFAKPTISQGGYVWTFGPNSNPESYPSISLNRNRWGWAGKIYKSTLPLTFQLWAGCGLNNTTNGVLVGNVSISSTGTVTYTATGGCMLSEVHVYLAADQPATIAPGQYGNTYSFDPAVITWNSNFTLPEGDFFWFIGHAVAKIPIPPTK
jgi:hypothetical protein